MTLMVSLYFMLKNTTLRCNFKIRCTIPLTAYTDGVKCASFHYSFSGREQAGSDRREEEEGPSGLPEGLNTLCFT